MMFIRQNMSPLQEILVVTAKRALNMEALGFKSFNLGPEPEFFLFKLDENRSNFEVNDKGGYFDLAPTDLADNISAVKCQCPYNDGFGSRSQSP